MWRDGQKKRVFVYRFLSTGTIEEKVYQRQLSKEGLQNVVNNEAKGSAAPMSAEELRDLFTLRSTLSDTYDSMCCSSGEDDSEREASQPGLDALLKTQVRRHRQMLCTLVVNMERCAVLQGRYDSPLGHLSVDLEPMSD